MSLAADGEDENGLELEKLRLNFQVVSVRLQIIDINDRGQLFAFCELRLHLPLDIQRKKSLISRIVWGKTPQNPRDVAPLNFIFITVFVSVFFFFF